MNLWKKYQCMKSIQEMYTNIETRAQKSEKEDNYTKTLYGQTIIIESQEHHPTQKIWPSKTLYTLGIKILEHENNIDIIVVRDQHPWKELTMKSEMPMRDNIPYNMIEKLSTLPPNSMVELLPQDHQESQHESIKHIRQNQRLNIQLHEHNKSIKKTYIHNHKIENIITQKYTKREYVQEPIPNGYHEYGLRLNDRIIFLRCNNKRQEWTISNICAQI